MENKPPLHLDHEEGAHTVFGFWIYLLTDLMFFGVLFATYSVLSRAGTFGGITPKEILSFPFATGQSFLMLLSALTAGIGGVCVHKKQKGGLLFFFSLTLFLGLFFLKRMGGECSALFAQGYDWTSTGFLSIYFTLMGTFALHVVLGIVWIVLFILLLLREKELSAVSVRRWTCLRLFWQFMNLIWVFIFTFVYGLGAI